MNTNDFALWGCLQSEWIIVAQVFLGGKRQFVNILDGLNIIGADVHFLHLVTIEGYIVIDIRYNLVQSFAL